jgi:hypothetical protein
VIFLALQQTHISFLKEIIEKHPKYFKKINKKAMFYGSVYPDMFYADIFFKKNNFSKQIHKTNSKEVIKIGLKMLKLSKNNFEKSFSLGFISHFILDNRIHNYLEKIKLYNRAEHLSLEFYLQLYVLNTEKIIIYKTPKKLLKKVFNELSLRESIKVTPGFLKKELFLFVCNYLIKETYQVYYSKTKKNNIFKKLFLKICFYPTIKSYGYKVYDLFNPNYNLLKKNIPDLIREYDIAKKEFYLFLKNNTIVE